MADSVEQNQQDDFISDNSEEAKDTQPQQNSNADEIVHEEETVDLELEIIKNRLRETEEETEKLRQLQNDASFGSPTGEISSSSSTFPTFEEKAESDSRSIFVRNLDYGTTEEELQDHFFGCGAINRVSIMRDKFTGHPKGFAYVEFADQESVQTALELDDSLFRGRQIQVTLKRTNRPGFSSTGRGFRGFGGRRFQRSRGNWIPGRGFNRPMQRAYRFAPRFSPY